MEKNEILNELERVINTLSDVAAHIKSFDADFKDVCDADKCGEFITSSLVPAMRGRALKRGKIGCVVRNAADYLEEDEFEKLCKKYGIIPSCFRAEESNVIVFRDRATAYDWLKRVNLIDSGYEVVEGCGVCESCGSTLFESDITGYKYQCFTCDEDFYSFEQEEVESYYWVIKKPVEDCAGGYIDNKTVYANLYSEPDGYDSNVATFNTPKAARMWLRENKLLNKGYKIVKIAL